MVIRMTIGVLALMATTVVPDVYTTHHQGKAVGPTVTFEVATRTTLGMPIVGAFEVRNALDSTVRVDVGSWNRKSGLRFALISPDGTRQVAQPQPPPLGGVHAGGAFDVSPGEVVRESFVVDEWLSLSSVGRYTLTIRLEGEFSTADAAPVAVQWSMTRQIDVMPRDAEQVAARCRELVTSIRSRHGDVALNAAAELALMRDVVAIPFMVEALQLNPRLEQKKLVDGLVRIGAPARPALERLAAGGDRDVAAWATTGLRAIR